jgi:hypothetical protein
MEGKTIGWIRKQFIKASEQRLDPNRKIPYLLFGDVMKIGGMDLWDDPGLKGET